jgi:hypothetical protein
VPDGFSRFRGSDPYLVQEHGLDLDSARVQSHDLMKRHTVAWELK